MTTKSRRLPGATPRATRLARPPDFDAAAADALAVVTLFASGSPRDAEMAGRLLDETMAAPNGQERVAEGMTSVCAGLLVLLEFYGRLPPERSLAELGRLIAAPCGPTASFDSAASRRPDGQ